MRAKIGAVFRFSNGLIILENSYPVLWILAGFNDSLSLKIGGDALQASFLGHTLPKTCYLLEGNVKVYPDGFDEAVQIAAGDLVVFPKGMSCTWDVSEAVDKHYKFD
ncbi:UNVERIFIED_CONTAM: hypothetical protein Scaly_2675000 [Sesamum calycinum]|uniref:(S)-ureidoglycine aminohydrolase cupin domain-containing protein n=1 Tax=Sesamum calycinum TaxID=2727403 RepID=A0AAW2J934_9LAMI